MAHRIFVVCVSALALAGCASWFGGHRGHHGPAPEEWHPPRTILLAYDANHDGTLTRAELDKGLKADFAKADTNHDGHLDEEEARAVNLARWSTDSSTSSPLVDWNSDGFVDFSEFAATARSLFEQMDEDGDGKLTKEELHPAPHRERSERPAPVMGPGDPDPY